MWFQLLLCTAMAKIKGLEKKNKTLGNIIKGGNYAERLAGVSERKAVLNNEGSLGKK